MTKFKVTCYESVSTVFFVEAENLAALNRWLANDGASAASLLTERQTVHERSFDVKAPPEGPDWRDADYNTKFSIEEGA